MAILIFCTGIVTLSAVIGIVIFIFNELIIANQTTITIYPITTEC